MLPPLWRRRWFEGLEAMALNPFEYLLDSYRFSQITWREWDKPPPCFTLLWWPTAARSSIDG